MSPLPKPAALVSSRGCDRRPLSDFTQYRCLNLQLQRSGAHRAPHWGRSMVLAGPAPGGSWGNLPLGASGAALPRGPSSSKPTESFDPSLTLPHPRLEILETPLGPPR